MGRVDIGTIHERKASACLSWTLLIGCVVRGEAQSGGDVGDCNASEIMRLRGS